MRGALAMGAALSAITFAVGCPVGPLALCSYGECAATDAGDEGTRPAGCTASPHADATVVRDECGVFVSPDGNDANAGTMLSPMKTIAHALDAARAHNHRLYVCAGSFHESVVIDDRVDFGVEIYGG